METILITGANRGIGLQLCKEFTAAGWSVLAACRNPDAASELSSLAGNQLRMFPLDVTSASSVAALATALKDETIKA
jgi:NAD(P)-dependent dehydrogenase (short-subunit alcohol dehydrogenase family)